MRLLFLTSRLPFPPDRGDRLRVFGFLRRLSAEHEITLASFISNEQEREHVASLSTYCSEVHVVRQTFWQSVLAVALNAWRATPLQVLYYRSSRMQRKVNELAATTPFDAVYVHLFRMAPYAARLHDIYRVVDLTDVISQEIKQSLPFRNLLPRALYSIEGTRIERYERVVAEACDEAWLISERDRRILARACAEASLHVIPNGVDLEQFSPAETSPSQVKTPATTPGRFALVFVGNMSVLHNIDAVHYLVDKILPIVRMEIPEAHLDVVGANPVRSIRALQNKHPGVTVRGFVDDLGRVLNQASVFVAPMRFAAGVQTKVVEAMAAGMAVVTTSVVNDGLEAVPRRDLLIGDDETAIANHVVNLCRDPELRRQMGAAARNFAAEHFSWNDAVDRVRTIQANL